MTNMTTARQAMQLEYSALGRPTHCPLGVYVLPSPDDPCSWSCVIFVHRGYYAGAILHFLITVPATYPNDLPSCYFLTSIFHPLVDPGTGKFSLKDRFPVWRTNEDNLFRVLHFIKASFKKQSLDAILEEQAVNSEAWRLYRDQTSLFTKLANQSAALSRSDAALYKPETASAHAGDRPASAIKFTNIDEAQQRELRNKLEESVRAKIVKT